MVDLIEIKEKEKYLRAWNLRVQGRSQTAKHIAKYISRLNPEWKMLELGCGDGFVVKTLKEKKFNILGIDIALIGFQENFIQTCIWNLPFKNNSFDFTFSTDVLEHLPTERINQTIKEIFRVTKIETFHIITVWESNGGGFKFHLTVKEIEWWKERFKSLNVKNLKLKLLDRKRSSQVKLFKELDNGNI